MYTSHEILESYLDEWKKNDRMPEELAKVIITMTVGLAGKYRFYGEPEDIAHDAILVMLNHKEALFAKRVDQGKNYNLFGYFTTIIFNEYRGRYKKRKSEIEKREGLRQKMESELSRLLRAGADLPTRNTLNYQHRAPKKREE